MRYAAFLSLWSLLILTGCDNNQQSSPAVDKTVPEPAVPHEDHHIPENAIAGTPEQRQFDIDNTRYLFVLSDHTSEELQALLSRADRIARTSFDEFNQLEIAMVIHGPSINVFTRKNYPGNRQLVNLAAKLDAFDVIDLKICETSMSREGVSRSDVPAFIDSVPFAPDEIKRLTSEGYITL